MADQLPLAVRPYAGPGNALISMPGPASRAGTWSDGLEGFARTWLAPFVRAWVPDNDWVWFRAVAAAFSRSAGGAWDQADIDYAINRAEGRTAISRHQAHWPAPDGSSTPGPWLTTASIVNGNWEVRLVRVAPDSATGKYTLRTGGWAVAAEDPPTQQEGEDTASVQSADGLTSRVTTLHGTMTPGVHRPAERHAFGSHAAIPYLHSTTQVSPGETYAAAISLSAAPTGPGNPPRLTINRSEANKITATVTWPDGTQNQLTL